MPSSARRRPARCRALRRSRDSHPLRDDGPALGRCPAGCVDFRSSSCCRAGRSVAAAGETTGRDEDEQRALGRNDEQRSTSVADNRTSDLRLATALVPEQYGGAGPDLIGAGLSVKSSRLGGGGCVDPNPQAGVAIRLGQGRSCRTARCVQRRSSDTGPARASRRSASGNLSARTGATQLFFEKTGAENGRRRFGLRGGRDYPRLACYGARWVQKYCSTTRCAENGSCEMAVTWMEYVPGGSGTSVVCFPALIW
jgi:hypothetical protein